MAGDLRVVQGAGVPEPVEPAEPVTMAAALAVLAERIAAVRPKIFLAIYEDKDGKLVLESLPDSTYVQRVLVDAAYAFLHPNSDVADRD